MKKKISILLLVFLVSSMLSIPAMASETTNTANGFYNIETVENVTITPYAGENVVTSVNQDLDGDGIADEWYQNSDRMKVSYNAATTDGYYGLIMVEGDDLPTVENAIFYVDQITATSNTVDFDVYPILPEENTDLTIYISSNVEGHNLVTIGLSYVVGATPAAPQYTLGDIDDNGKCEVDDALLTLQMIAELYSPTETEILAADVDCNGKLEVDDALMILQYVAEIIDSWN